MREPNESNFVDFVVKSIHFPETGSFLRKKGKILSRFAAVNVQNCFIVGQDNFPIVRKLNALYLGFLLAGYHWIPPV